ncbi:1-acyl-sn-glycerol-3-phosphate acyltransferase [Candidatus Neomarinimicrobiota bacterium]
MNKSSVGPLLPRNKNWIRKMIGKFLLFSYRWSLDGDIHNSSKLIIILAPHTSYWDFLSNMGTLLALGLQGQWLIAKEFCWWPLGVLLKWLGAIPIDRNSSQNIVTQMIDKINSSEKLLFALYPEGATRKVQKWKTGFWHIADETSTPIQILKVDYSTRSSIFSSVIETSGDINRDMKLIQNYFKGIKSKNPEKFGGEYID